MPGHGITNHKSRSFKVADHRNRLIVIPAPADLEVWLSDDEEHDFAIGPVRVLAIGFNDDGLSLEACEDEAYFYVTEGELGWVKHNDFTFLTREDAVAHGRKQHTDAAK